MKSKNYRSIISIFSLLILILFIYTSNNQKDTTAIKNFLTTLFTATKYDTIESIIPEGNDKNSMLEVFSHRNYHIDYKSIQNSMVEKEFNYLLVNRFITISPRIANKFNTPIVIDKIMLTPKNKDVYYFEVLLTSGYLQGPIKGEISVEKLKGKWIVTYIYLNTNSLKSVLNTEEDIFRATFGTKSRVA